jgi:Glycosyl hydrolases family 39
MKFVQLKAGPALRFTGNCCGRLRIRTTDSGPFEACSRAARQLLTHNLGSNASRYKALLIFIVFFRVAEAQSVRLVPAQISVPQSFFGMHIHHLVADHGVVTPWPGVEIPAWRLWDAHVTWPDLEPAKGQWRFATLDKLLALAQEHHTEVILTLGFTPSWASARPQEKVGYGPGWAAEPANIEDWHDFVQTIANRYKGRVRIYEVWNEPNLKTGYWTGSVEKMVELVKVARQVIKSVDPDAVLVSPPVTAAYGVTWLSEYLRRGGGQYVDVIGYHFYVNPGPPEEIVAVVQKVKQILLENNIEPKPLWDTETGWLSSSQPISDDLGAAYLARSYILLWAAGVQRFYWFAWDNRKLAVSTTRLDNKTLTPAGEAFAVIQKWLVGARLQWCEQDPSLVWTCQLNRDGKRQWIVWNPAGTKVFTIPKGWQARGIESLLGQSEAINGGTVSIGPIPILVSTSLQ